MFNEIWINEVLNKRYKYPDKYMDPKNTGKYWENTKWRWRVQVWICSYYSGQKLHRCPVVCVCGWKQLVSVSSRHIHNVEVKLFSGAESCQIQVLNVLSKSPAVQQVILEAPTTPHMPPNQRDKLLITSGHLSVRVRPSVAQWGPAIPHNTVPQPTPAVWLNGCRCLKASVHSLNHALQRRMMSLRRLQQAVQSNTWRTLSTTSSSIHQVYLAASAMYNPHPKFIFTDTFNGFEGKNYKLFLTGTKKWKNITQC